MIYELTQDLILFNGCKAPKGLQVEDCTDNDHGICEEERKRTGLYQRFVSPAEKYRRFRDYSGYNSFPLPVAFLKAL